MVRGDVVELNLPPPTPGGGHVQAGSRFGVIISRDEASLETEIISYVPFTKNQKALRFPHTFLIDPSFTNGLTLPSVALVFQVTALDKRFISGLIGQLETKYIHLIEGELNQLFCLK
jgi:mRNA interferase MazF